VKRASETKTAEANELNETRKQTTRNNERIKRDRQQAEYDNQKSELELLRLKRDGEFEIEKMRNQLLQDQEKIKNEQTVARLRQEFEIEFARKRLDLDKEHNDLTLQKYQIDATERIYTKLGIKEVKINQFTGDSKTSLAALLPQLGFASAQVNAGNS
jgi:hypothetical protein